MPIINFSDILSYSSEDENNPATSLLSSNGSKKWKCKSGLYEKQHHVIIKFDKLANITSIDIGNEHAAFIEVLSGREGVDFQVLLVASSFMTPLESRNSTNINRVRMFDMDKLNTPVAEQKWDRIKIICTQPFNKNVQFGLSFIVVRGKSLDPINSDKDEETKKSVIETKIGKFTLKESPDSSEDSSSGMTSLFSSVKESNPSMAASIRAASNRSILKNDEKELKTYKRNADEFSDKSIGDYQKKKAKYDTKDRSQIKTATPDKKLLSPIINKTDASKIKINEPMPMHAAVQVTKSSGKEHNSSQSIKSIQSKPFKKLMNDVIFCLSGFQNPKRSELRDKLLKMGAKYKGDWDRTCSHLVCAFANTPKYNSVKGKGKIVQANWVEDCYKNKKRFPWRRYNMEKNRNADESEEEILSSEILPENKESEVNKPSSSMVVNDEDSEDTDTEIENALNFQNGTNNENNSSNSKKKDIYSDDEYDMDTDVDDENGASPKSDNKSLTDLPCYFEGKSFFLYGFSNKLKQKELMRYIISFKGKISNYMSKTTHYVITDALWDDNFDDALNDNPSLQFIKSQWVWKCYDKQKLVPCQPYLISCNNT